MLTGELCLAELFQPFHLCGEDRDGTGLWAEFPWDGATGSDGATGLQFLWEKKKENKMKHFAVVNGKSIAGHDLFFLFNPVP